MGKIEYEVIKKKAEEIRKECDCKEIPIDIEKIIEGKYKISINTEYGLKDKIKKSAWINSNYDKILIDSEEYEKFEARARFSLAHEFGHYILHKDDECKEEEDRESEADIFANYLLIPEDLLIKKVILFLESKEKLSEVKITDELIYLLIKKISQNICNDFNVSSVPIEIAMKKSGLKEKIREKLINEKKELRNNQCF